MPYLIRLEFLWENIEEWRLRQPSFYSIMYLGPGEFGFRPERCHFFLYVYGILSCSGANDTGGSGVGVQLPTAAVSAFLMEKAPRPDRQRSTVPETDYFISRLTAVIGSVQRSCISPPLWFPFGRLGIILRAGGCISAHCVGEYRRVWRNWQTRRI